MPSCIQLDYISQVVSGPLLRVSPVKWSDFFYSQLSMRPRWELQGFLWLRLKIFDLAVHAIGQATHRNLASRFWFKGWRPQVSMGEAVAKNFQPSLIYHILLAFDHKRYHVHYSLPEPWSFVTFTESAAKFRMSPSKSSSGEDRLLGYSPWSMVPLNLRASPSPLRALGLILWGSLCFPEEMGLVCSLATSSACFLSVAGWGPKGSFSFCSV